MQIVKQESVKVIVMETIHYEKISNIYAYRIREDLKDNLSVIKDALDKFEENGCTRVCDYEEMTGLKNNYEMLIDKEANPNFKELNEYVNLHFENYEKFLADICKQASRVISYKPHKQELIQIRMVLCAFKEPEFSDYSGIVSDLLNDVQNIYLENNVISERQAKRMFENEFEQFCVLQSILARKTKQIIKIIDQHDLPLLFEDYPYGIPNLSYNKKGDDSE